MICAIFMICLLSLSVTGEIRTFIHLLLLLLLLLLLSSVIFLNSLCVWLEKIFKKKIKQTETMKLEMILTVKC